MKKKVIKEKNNDGLHTKVETIEKDFDDGFANVADFYSANDFHPSNLKNHKEFHKGVAKTVLINTNDPRITRPFLKIICGFIFIVAFLFLLIGIISFSVFNIILAIIIIVFVIITYSIAKKSIDNIEEELKQNEEYVNTDSKEVQKEFINDIENEWKDVKKSVFNKKNSKKFFKETILIYSFIAIIIFLLISFFVNIILGLIILGILILCGFSYYWIIFKICK